MTFTQFFLNLRIRYKLLISYLITCGVILLGFVFLHAIVRKTIEANIESELKNSTSAILSLVRTSVSVSIKNHLRSAAESNIGMVRHLYSRYEKGELTENEARRQAEALLLSQRIGTTGYIACVSSQGVMVVHPKREWLGEDIRRHAFVKQMMAQKNGYIEYEWKNPGETHARPKAMYMTYFAPWDWIISVSSYRNEFMTLVNIDDFRENVLSFRSGESGYSFVTDEKGNIIIHPILQGINILEQNEFPSYPLETIFKEKTGKLLYSWKNPGEDHMRKKLVMYNYLPEYKWIVASSSYLDEFYKPLDKVSKVMIFSIMASFLILLPVIAGISSSITNPLVALIKRLEAGTRGDFSVRLTTQSGDEVGQIALYFNSFMDKLEAEIHERKEAEAALRISEDRYRSVIEAMPDPMVVYDMEGRVTYLNPAFADVFGWTAQECMGKKLDHFVPEGNWEETHKGLATITSGQSFSKLETRRYTKAGLIIDVSIRGAIYRDQTGNQVGSVIIHRDVSDLKHLEKQVMDIGDRERQKIGQDLHDDLCPHLIGIEGLCKVLVRTLKEKVPEDARLADKITQLIKDAIIKTRRMARGLCPVYLVDHGLESSLREFSMNTESVFNVSCRFESETPVLIRDNIVATHLFHIAQEAVHNAIRHGAASQVYISLRHVKTNVVLRIEDDGKGIPQNLETNGMGLRIMAFRANMINASLDIKSNEGKGTVVQASLNLI